MWFLSYPTRTVPARVEKTAMAPIRKADNVAKKHQNQEPVVDVGRSGDRDKALDMAMGQIERQFGKGAIMKMGDRPMVKAEIISTGALAVDLALGIGGVPRGRVVEIFGPEASGKTTLSLHIVAEAQRNGGIAAFIDAEHALDPI